MESTMILLFLDCPVISPLPPNPEPVEQDSTIQDNRSFSGPPKATEQSTVDPGSNKENTAFTITDFSKTSFDCDDQNKIHQMHYIKGGPKHYQVMARINASNVPYALDIELPDRAKSLGSTDLGEFKAVTVYPEDHDMYSRIKHRRKETPCLECRAQDIDAEHVCDELILRAMAAFCLKAAGKL